MKNNQTCQAISTILKSLTFIFVLISLSTKSFSQLEEWPKMKELTLKEIRTASNKILVVYFLGPELHEVMTDLSGWNINGKQPLSVHKWVTPNWDCTDFGYEHHIYLFMREAFVQNEKYTVQTPHGDTTFTFNSKEVFCESIKTNQSAYSALSKARYANLAIWTGTGGGQKIDTELPKYEVYETYSGKRITQGKLRELGKNENSGDFVYRIDLSTVPEGGPYQIEVKGYGSSYPFAVGGEYANRLAYVAFRGLLHQRCGIEQKKPYFEHDIREKCHPLVYVTDSPSKEAQITISPDDPIIKTHGGYHDAGDADRRDHHMSAPIILLSYFDMFPEYFSDQQFNIPDKFDSDFHPIGQGNGIPDIIDEAEWGTAIFEILQEENGGVRSGTERTGYPKDDVGLDQDTARYGTFEVSKNSSSLAAGLFAHLARALKPYNQKRADELQARAEKAWAFAGQSAMAVHQLYYYTQYYLLTGDQDIHQKLVDIAPVVNTYVTKHQDNPRKVHDSDVLPGAYFFSYLTQNEHKKNAAVVNLFKQAIKLAAERRMTELGTNYWPNGTSEPNRWWGSQTAQGQYADPILMQWRLTGEQKYINAASQLMDYNQGLNPIGISYLTGTGFNRTSDPLHHDSYPMKAKGWGPAPGIQVFGPGNLHQLKENCPSMIPNIDALPAQRQWLDNRRNVSGCEFTVPESLAYPSVIYTILAGGGKWDRKTDLYFDPKKSSKTN